MRAARMTHRPTPLRLLFVATSLGSRGTEQHLMTLALAMKNRGHQVTGLFDARGFLARAAQAHQLPFSLATFRNALDPRGWWPLVKQIRAQRPDWVIGVSGHEYFPISVVGWVLGCKVALFRHLNSALGRMTRQVLPKLFERMVAVSKDMQGDLMLQGIAAEKLSLLYNPIDVVRFAPNAEHRLATRAQLSVGDDEVLVGFVGSMGAAKGAPMFAGVLNQVMALEPSLRALWLGAQKEHDSIRQLVEPGFRHRHHFLAWVDAVERVYPALDVLAVPSQWREPFGRVSVEAQACGVTVLASAVGGLPETLVPGEGAALLSPTDSQAWVEAIVAYARLTSAARAQQRGAAVASAARFASPVIAQQFERLLREPTSGADP